MIRCWRWVIDGSWVIGCWGWVIGSWFGVIRSWVVWSRFGVIRSWFGNIFGGWVIWGWSWLRWVIWSGFGVIRSWFWVVWFVVCFAFISDISCIAVFMVCVISYNLCSAIGKGNSVFTRNNAVLVLYFVLAEINTRIFIHYAIFIGKWPWWDFFVWCVVWHWFVYRSWMIWFWCWMVWSWCWVIWSRRIRIGTQCESNTTKKR